MKKIISVLICTFLTLAAFSGCGNNTVKETGKSDKLSVVTTILPEYDWTREILGEQAENTDLTLLLDKGVDLHSYQPTADDIAKISDCDLFIYVGGESDGWVDDALKNATNKNMKVINLLDTLGNSVKTEETVEGMQEEEHDHEHGEDEPHDEEHKEEEKDEHVWLSLKNAEVICNAISSALQELAPENKDVYAKNTADYTEKLSALDAEYQSTVDTAARKMLFLDEPVSGLDPKSTADMYGLVESINKEDNIAVVMISHDIVSAVKYASHILHIGNNIFFGTKEEYIKSDIGRNYLKQGGGIEL